jgi:hypothetical protein
MEDVVDGHGVGKVKSMGLGTDNFGYLERAYFLSVQLLAGASGTDVGGAKPDPGVGNGELLLTCRQSMVWCLDRLSI